MTSRSIKIVLTVLLAIVAAIVITVVLYYYQSNKTPQMTQEMATSTVAKLALLSQMSPQPASTSTVAKESKTLNAVSKSSAKSSSSSSAQYKLEILSQMSH